MHIYIYMWSSMMPVGINFTLSSHCFCDGEILREWVGIAGGLYLHCLPFLLTGLSFDSVSFTFIYNNIFLRSINTWCDFLWDFAFWEHSLYKYPQSQLPHSRSTLFGRGGKCTYFLYWNPFKMVTPCELVKILRKIPFPLRCSEVYLTSKKKLRPLWWFHDL